MRTGSLVAADAEWRRAQEAATAAIVGRIETLRSRNRPRRLRFVTNSWSGSPVVVQYAGGLGAKRMATLLAGVADVPVRVERGQFRGRHRFFVKRARRVPEPESRSWTS